MMLLRSGGTDAAMSSEMQENGTSLHRYRGDVRENGMDLWTESLT